MKSWQKGQNHEIYVSGGRFIRIFPRQDYPIPGKRFRTKRMLDGTSDIKSEELVDRSINAMMDFLEKPKRVDKHRTF